MDTSRRKNAKRLSKSISFRWGKVLILEYIILDDGSGRWIESVDGECEYSFVRAQIEAWMPLPEPYKRSDEDVD